MEFNAMRNSVEDFDAGKATDRPYQWNNFTPEEIANRPEIGPYDKPRQTHINDITPRNFVEVCVDLKQQGLAGLRQLVFTSGTGIYFTGRPGIQMGLHFDPRSQSQQRGPKI